MENESLKTEFKNVIEKIKNDTKTLDLDIIENLDTLGDSYDVTEIREKFLNHIDYFENLSDSISKEQFDNYKKDYYSDIKTGDYTFEELLDKFSALSKGYDELQKQETAEQIDKQTIQMVRETNDAAGKQIERQFDTIAKSEDETVLQYLSYKLQELIDWLIDFLNNLMSSAKLG